MTESEVMVQRLTSTNFLGFDVLVYSGVEREDDEEFLIKHINDESQDITITCTIDEDNETVEWDGLSELAVKRLGEFEFTML